MQTEKIDCVKIGQRIQQTRIALDLTQPQVIDMIGWTVKHLSAVETGSTRPSIELLLALRTALNVSLEDFFVDTPQANREYIKNEEVMSRVDQMTPETLANCLDMMDIMLRMQNQ